MALCPGNARGGKTRLEPLCHTDSCLCLWRGREYGTGEDAAHGAGAGCSPAALGTSKGRDATGRAKIADAVKGMDVLFNGLKSMLCIVQSVFHYRLVPCRMKIASINHMRNQGKVHNAHIFSLRNMP